MSAKWQFRLFHLLVFVVLTGLVVYTFHTDFWLLLAVELFILLLILLSFYLFKAIFNPIDKIKLGLDAIKDSDFTIRINNTGRGEVDAMINVYNALLDNLRKERRYQREQHFFLSQLLENLPMGVFILDFDDNISQYNPFAASNFNVGPEAVGKHIATVLPFWEAAMAAPNTPLHLSGNAYFRMRTNAIIQKGFKRKLVLLEEVSQEVITIEKKAYGQVIRMMAHEVKNSVAAVNSILESVGSELPKAEAKLLALSAQRNHALNRFVNNFAKVVRIPEPKPLRTELVAWAEDVLGLMQPKAAKEGITLLLEKPKQAVYVTMDAGLMEQAVINLLLNAIEASAAAPTKKVVLQLHDNGFSVIDYGTGISPEMKDKLFSPFFSTKPQGQGVGLTMVRDILGRHGFNYQLKSEGGQTNFDVFFGN